MRDACQLVLHHQLRPADRADLADAREVVALEVDDHHVLCRVLRVVHVLADRPRPLDRFADEPVTAAREEELGRGRDDRPAVTGERPWMERVERRERVREPGGAAGERRREMLHQVDLVDVATRNRRAHRVDRSRVVLGRPRRLPLPESEARL